MQLVINTYGSYLRKNGNCFLIKKEDKSFEVAVNKVNSILITTAAYITTDAIKLAIDNNIDIVFLDSHGEPYGRVWHPKLGSTTLIRRRQLEIYDQDKGLNLVKDWGLQKLDNQIELLSLCGCGSGISVRAAVPRKQGLKLLSFVSRTS